jgi:hypothetical protein
MVDEDTNMKGNWVKGIGNSVFSLRFYYKYGIAPKKLIQKWKHLMLAVVDHNVAVCISWTLMFPESLYKLKSSQENDGERGI